MLKNLVKTVMKKLNQVESVITPLDVLLAKINMKKITQIPYQEKSMNLLAQEKILKV